MSLSVAIIGGGYAGMACAVELAHKGHGVTVFERSMMLGGRARVLIKDGWQVDNGQHILLGAYTELTRLMRLTGVSPKQLERLPLTLHIPGKLHLKAANLPAPFHLAVGLLFARGLDWRDRRAMLRLMRHLSRHDYRLDADMSVRALLHVTDQTEAIAELVWNPLCLAALNTPPAEASAQVFANVLRDSLGANASASELLIPKLDLSELFPVAAARYLAVRRGRVHTACAVDGIRTESGKFRLQGDAAGTGVYDAVVVATAPYHASALLKSVGGCERLAAQIDQLPFEPITTIYLAFGESVSLPFAMIGLLDGPAQWAFDRGRFGGEPGLIALVISAGGPHEELAKSELERAAHRQLEQALNTSLPKPEWSLTVSEKRATFACRPGISRPGRLTPVNGLWLAGDYVESLYPATLESAVRSGTAVANAISRSVG